MRTLIIAEAGVNHNGDMALARRLIEVAADAGADRVKFQTFKATQLATNQAKKAAYQTKTTGVDESQLAMLTQLELTEAMHQELIAHCRVCQIPFFSTAFDRDSIDLLVKLGMNTFKIPSGEITNLPYLRYIGHFGKPIILSTGMSTLQDVENALKALEAAGTPREIITALHCSTDYPTVPEDVNLKAMLTMRDTFGVQVGYSDHTAGIEVAIAAVALGASVIEKHFTLDRNLPGPDHRASLEPAELKAMVAAIRNIELALGDGVKKPSETELENSLVARKSLVAACPIRKGDYFSSTNMTTKRPGIGISPMRWDDMLGHQATRDYQADELIEL